MFINFNDIPGHNKLFLDYLYKFDNVKDFYGFNFRNKEDFLQKFKIIADQFGLRSELHNIITGQYKEKEPSQKTQKNISMLKEKNTLAVVTGQQLGILGGPLYTFYKTITALKLCKHLNERYDEYQFEPVFWLEADDHDFDEVRSINILNGNNDIKKISYSDEHLPEENTGSIGYLKFSESINNFFEELNNFLKDSEFKQPMMDKLKSSFGRDKTFKEAFSELIFWIFDEYGLILFDPQEAVVKNILKPLFKKEISDFRQHTEKLVHVSAKLEELYHAQVKVRPINLFYNFDGGRYLIEPIENEYRLKGKRKKFIHDELIELIEKEPQNFSPNVLMRPVCQDHLFPTAFYIAGPSEISYFAQALPLYGIYNIQPPIFYPRSSATILEKNISSIMEKFGLDIRDVFVDSESLKRRIIESVSKNSLNEIFTGAMNNIELILDQLKEKLFEIDKTMSDSSTRYKQKILNDLGVLKEKSLEAEKKKHEITLRQIDKVSNMLFPNSNLQEREFNFIYFADKYGMDFIKQIYDELSINKFEHQIISI
ncbi:MAG TPA: bacillithiol biosynthesis cysteine-adding enzyme BshC [Ignavibacteriaceae bacterium]|nr:bacillithiol biosynthesis cysteine-adding enzyme BshC [Ignavibacteriaceae bacterium]